MVHLDIRCLAHESYLRKTGDQPIRTELARAGVRTVSHSPRFLTCTWSNVAKKSAPRSTKKPQSTKKQPDVAHPGMMGDGTEEQNLDERGNPGARIKKDEVDAAFGRQAPKKRK